MPLKPGQISNPRQQGGSLYQATAPGAGLTLQQIIANQGGGRSAGTGGIGGASMIANPLAGGAPGAISGVPATPAAIPQIAAPTPSAGIPQFPSYTPPASETPDANPIVSNPASVPSGIGDFTSWLNNMMGQQFPYAGGQQTGGGGMSALIPGPTS